jgi:esterase/lipase superfamily enzyme
MTGIKHYIITNREILNEHRRNESIRPDGREEARDELRFGEYHFAHIDDPGEVVLYRDLDEEGLMRFQDKAKTPKNFQWGSQRVFDALYEEMLHPNEIGKDTLVFIHGFNTDLASALRTLRSLHKEYVENRKSPIKNIVLFTWPSRGQLLRYRDDARDATITGYALGRAFKIFHDFLISKFGKDPSNPKSQPCEAKLHLLVHSMGNRVLEAMMAWLSHESRQQPSLFDEVVLVGADVDYDAIEKPRALYNLIDICQRVHVYYHANDMALQVSRRTKNALNRLGLTGTKKKGELPDSVYEYNVSHTREDRGFQEKMVNHWYYYNTTEVVEDIVEVLRGNESMYLKSNK